MLVAVGGGAVLLGVRVEVAVGPGGDVFVRVGVRVGVRVAVRVGVRVAEAVGVRVGVKVEVNVAVGVRVGEAVKVAVNVRVGVRLGVRLMLGVRVGDEASVRVGVALAPTDVPVAVADGGGAPGVPVGWGVHQNQPTTVPPSLKSSATGFRPVSSSISSTMAGSTGWKAITCQER